MRKESGGAKGKERAGKSVFLYIDIVYNSIIEIRKRKRRDKGMFIIYRTLFLIRKHKGVL